MRLLWSSRSPFARKVMIAAHELGLADQIATERVVVDAANPNPAVMAINPLGRIPVLILEDGSALHDSRVVIEYLDGLAGHRLAPLDGAGRWRALTWQAVADGIMEADVRWLEEKRLPEAERRPRHVAGMKLKIATALDRFEADPPGDAVTVGVIALAAALSHLDFRFPDEPWRPGRPRLTAWFDAFSERPSMIATRFVDQY